MPENKTQRLERNLKSFAGAIMGENNTIVERKAKRISEIVASMSGYEAPEAPEEPGDPELGPLIPQAHYGLFTWNWFLWKAWNPATRDKWIAELKKTMTAVRKLGFATHEIFSWVSSGRPGEAHYNKKLPWTVANGKVRFLEHEENWWDIYRAFLKVHKDLGMEVMITLFLRPAYTKWALNNAKDGPKDFFSDEMFFVWKMFARSLILKYQKVYGPDSFPPIKPSNEWNHKASGPGKDKNENGYIFSQFHVAIYDAIKGLMPQISTLEKVRNIVCNPNALDERKGSEWVQAGFTYPHEAFGYMVGDKRFVDEKERRYVTIDRHKFAVIENYDIKGDFGIICRNSFWKPAIIILSEDCGGGWYMENGKRVYYGKGYRIGQHAVGDLEQTEEHTYYSQMMAKKYNRPIHNTFMNIECIKDGKEDCRLETLIERGSMARAEAFTDGIKAGLAS